MRTGSARNPSLPLTTPELLRVGIPSSPPTPCPSLPHHISAQLPSPSSPPRHWAPRGVPSSALSQHAEPQCTEGPHPWGSLQGKAVWFIQGHREGTWHRPGTSVSPSIAQARLHAPPGDKTHWGVRPAQGDNGQCSWVPGLSRAICGEGEACLLPPCLLSPHYLWMRTMLEIK